MTSPHPRHAVLASLGTDGDIYPFLALGRVLRERGYRVTLATHEHFAKKAAAAGLGFLAMVSHAETEALLKNPALWHPTRSPFVIAKWGSAFLERQYHQLTKLVREPNSVLVASIGVVAARLVQEKHSARLASIVLQPWMIPSSHAPPVFMSGLTLPRWAPMPLKTLYWRGADIIMDKLVGHDLNRLRSTLGLPKVRRVFHWWHSPELVIGLFPKWYGPPQPDWPPQMKLAGFPAGHRHTPGQSTAEVYRFCEAGPPPVAFTFGTGMMHARSLFEMAVKASEASGNRAILLTPFSEQIGHPLPPSVHHCAFAPFRELFPRCSAVVHHGGIGTTSDALAAGTPQLILPFAFDQEDNARRVQKLGAGTWLKPSRRSAPNIASKLRELDTSEIRSQARLVAAQAGREDGLEQAADMIG